jgi:hypothetical protein
MVDTNCAWTPEQATEPVKAKAIAEPVRALLDP